MPTATKVIKANLMLSFNPNFRHINIIAIMPIPRLSAFNPMVKARINATMVPIKVAITLFLKQPV